MTIQYHIADEEGYIYAVSDELVKDAIKLFNTERVVSIAVPKLYEKDIANYLGDKLDQWKSLPLLTAKNQFRRVGHVLTRG